MEMAKDLYATLKFVHWCSFALTSGGGVGVAVICISGPRKVEFVRREITSSFSPPTFAEKMHRQNNARDVASCSMSFTFLTVSVKVRRHNHGC